MSGYPKSVEFHEEGPREGFQIESEIFPIEQRAALIDALSESGLPVIQVGSFVNPKKVPAMADTAELFQRIKRRHGTQYVALWLSKGGFLQARKVPGITLTGDLIFYASDRLARANNDRSADQMRADQIEFVRMYDEHGVPLRAAYIVCALGCNMEGDIPVERITELVRYIHEITVGTGHAMPAIYLADTMGWGTPDSFRRRIDAVRKVVPDVRVGTHIHDTRGLGLANFHAALEMGVDLFDSSVAGLGGCPFASFKSRRAAGNVCTEDAVFLCHELGIETGVDLEKLIEAARFAQEILGRSLTGKVMHSGSLTSFRRPAAS